MITKNSLIKLELDNQLLSFLGLRGQPVPNSDFLALYIETEFLKERDSLGVFCQNGNCLLKHSDRSVYYIPVFQDSKSVHFETNPDAYEKPTSERFCPSDLNFSSRLDDFELIYSNSYEDSSGGKTLISEYRNSEDEFKLLVEMGAGLGFLGGVVFEFDGTLVKEDSNLLQTEDSIWDSYQSID